MTLSSSWFDYIVETQLEMYALLIDDKESGDHVRLHSLWWVTINLYTIYNLHNNLGVNPSKFAY